MRRLIVFLLLLVVSVCLGILMIRHPGYLFVVYQPWLIQMPLWLALIALVFLFGFFYLFVSGLDHLQLLWFRFKNWLQFRKEHRSYSKTQEGLSCLIEGRW